ncbi:MAG: hypothetical protein R2769_14340 [Saprospiraceae bacterium]
MHPRVSTNENIARYRSQLDNIGFSYDWSREVRTSDPNYFKWTQWIFLQLFGHYFCNDTQKARPIDELEVFSKEVILPSMQLPVLKKHSVLQIGMQ